MTAMTLHKEHRQFFNLLRWLMNRWIIRWIETVVSIIRTILSMYLRNFITNANNGHPPYQKKPKSPNPQTTQNWLVINKIDRVAHYVIYELGHFKVWYYNGRLTYFTIHCTCWRTNDDSTMHFILLQSATINATLPPPARVAMLGDACGSGSRYVCVWLIGCRFRHQNFISSTDDWRFWPTSPLEFMMLTFIDWY